MKLHNENIDSLPNGDDNLPYCVLSKKYLSNLFPDIEISDKDMETIRLIFQDEDKESVREFISQIIEYRELLGSEHCKSIQHFFTAMKFVSYMNMGYDIFDSYIKSHSYSKTVQNYLGDKHNKQLEESIKSVSKLFSKSKLVLLIQQASDTPFHLLFAGYRLQAIDRLRKEMNSASLSKDRIQASNVLLTHLSPQLQQQNININLGSNNKINIIDEYLQGLDVIAHKQLEIISEDKSKAIDVINVKTKGEDE